MSGRSLAHGVATARAIYSERSCACVTKPDRPRKNAQGYAIAAPPLVVKDKVIVGVAGGEYGIRGFIVALNAQTGKEVICCSPADAKDIFTRSRSGTLLWKASLGGPI